MTRMRYTMPSRSQGDLYAQRTMARLDGKDVHRWLVQRLDGFHCDLQVMYMPHIVLNDTPPLSSIARGDEVDARCLNARDAVKALEREMI